ncbi:hypothetical protein ACFX12_029576 [Malus domestica]
MSGLISLSVIISNILFASLTKPSLQRVSIKTLKIHSRIYVVPRPSGFVQHLAPSVGNDTKNHVLKWEDVEVGEPKKGEIRVKKEAIGINFTDVYYRKGLYKAATLPYTPGVEACGVVIAVGSDLIGRQVGDLVAYAGLDNSVSTSSLFQVSGGNAPLSPPTSSVIPTQDELKKITAYKAIGFVKSAWSLAFENGFRTNQRPLYWKISATIHEIRQNKQTVKQGISQIVLEEQKSVGWYHNESDSGAHYHRAAKNVGLATTRRLLLHQDPGGSRLDLGELWSADDWRIQLIPAQTT